MTDDDKKTPYIPMTERWAMDDEDGDAFITGVQTPIDPDEWTKEDQDWLEEVTREEDDIEDQLDWLLGDDESSKPLGKHLAGQHDQMTHGHDEESDPFDRRDQPPQLLFQDQQLSTWSVEFYRSIYNDVRVRESIDNYTGSAYEYVNGKLRNVPPRHKKDQWDNFDEDTVIAGLDEAFKSEKARAPENLTVFRGLGFELDDEHSRQQLGFLLSAKPGDVYQDRGFFSSTFSESVANTFAFGNEIAITMEIQLPSGSSVLPLQGFNDSGEFEVLLNRGSKFQVLSNTTRPLDPMGDDSLRKIKVRLLP